MRRRFSLFVGAMAALVSIGVFAGRMESEVKQARTKKGRVIRISPDGKAKDTIAWEDAEKSVQPGCVLQFAPGDYHSADLTEIAKDNIVIEGDKSGGLVSAQFILHGRNNIVRGLRAGRVEGRGLVVVDSVLGRLCFWSDKGRVSSYAFNCCFESIELYPNNAEFEFKNCSLARSLSGGHIQAVAGYGGHGTADWVSHAVYLGSIMEKKGVVSFENCVLYSNGNLFTLPTKEPGLLEFDLRDCFLFARQSLAQAPAKDAKSAPLEVKSMKSLENYFAVKTKGRIELKNPDFALPYPESVGWGWWQNIPGKNFVLSSSSLALKKGCGARIGDADMPDPTFFRE